jgi:hypothetical protein
MKNTFKVLGIIALVAVIGFSFVACGGDDDGGSSGGTGGGGGGGSSGGISGGTVTYPDGIADADKPIDFSFYFDGRVSPLSNFINDPASVTISGDKLTIKLGTPKDEYLAYMTKYYPSSISNGDITATPSDTKFHFPDAYFSTVDAKYVLLCGREGSEAVLAYADKDATIKGTHNTGKIDEIWNVSLKKGWNYLIHSTDQATDTTTYTSSVSMPSGFTWVVFAYR